MLMRLIRPAAHPLRLVRLLAMLLLVVAPLALAAEEREPTSQERLQAWSARDAELAKQLGEGALGIEEADEIRLELSGRVKEARALASALRTRDDPLEAQLNALGPTPEEGFSESETVAAERASLEGELARLTGLASQADAAAARAATLADQIAAFQLRTVTARLQERGPSILSPRTWEMAVMGLVKTVTGKRAEDDAPISTFVEEDLTLFDIGKIFATLLVAGALIYWGHAMARRCLRRSGEEGVSQLGRIGYAASAIFVRLFAVFVALGLIFFVARNTGALSSAHLNALARVLWIGVFASFIYGVVGVIFGPSRAAFGLREVDPKRGRRVVRSLIWLVVIMAVDASFLGWGTLQSADTETLIVANAISITLMAVIFLRLLFAYKSLRLTARSGEAESEETASGATKEEGHTESNLANIGASIQGYLVFVFAAVAVVAPLLALIGYFALSRYLLIHTIFTATLFAFLIASYRLADAAVDAYGQQLRESASGRAASLGIFNLLIACGLLFLGMVVLAFIWGASLTDIGGALGRLGRGIQMGDITVSPAGILRFLIILALVYAATRVVQAFLRASVLAKTQLDESARDAIATGTGYVGITLGAVLAASVSGLDLSNLALLAGALSVGIGFGLQTVVSNFVSGIILMVERPIRIGDWIAVGDHQGYVKRISVRSTEIETFDRASYIMPNADLIATPVLNWTLKSPIGRVICPVGVAYGSDVKQIMEVLQSIAVAHPLVLKRPAPSVLFLSFGDSSLNFEIRAFLRDVNYKLRVQSDLNVAIAERFAAEGIEIPFPQRDLHIKSMPEARPNGQDAERALNGKTEAREVEEETAPPPATSPSPQRGRSRSS